MAITYINSIQAVDTASAATLTMGGSLAIATGDLIIGASFWEDVSRTCTVAQTDASNSFTMRTLSNGGGNYMRMGYKIGAATSDAATFRMTLDDVATYKYFIIFQFRPDAGETVTYDVGENPATANTTACQSGNITTTGTDEVVVAFEKNYSGSRVESDIQIGDVAADGSLEAPQLSYGWYKIFDATQANIHGQLTFDSAAIWLCDILAIKSEAAGGGTGVWVLVRP